MATTAPFGMSVAGVVSRMTAKPDVIKDSFNLTAGGTVTWAPP